MLHAPADQFAAPPPSPIRLPRTAKRSERATQASARQQEPGSTDTTDVALIDLVTKLVEAHGRRQLFDRKCDELYEYVESVEMPSALAWHPADTPHVCLSPSESCATYVFGEQDCLCYENGIEDLTLWAQRFAREDDAYVNRMFGDKERARTREIIAAYDEWQAKQRQAEDAAGYTKQREGSDRETKLIGELLREIASTPARTLPGLGAKARAAAIAEHRTVAALRDKWLPVLLADADASNQEMLAVSLLVDVATVGAGGAA